MANQASDNVATFTGTWPLPDKGQCGDGTLNDEPPFNEECDDGNLVNGDGCSNACGIE
jgi:cysteine-rich repeat protein